MSGRIGILNDFLALLKGVKKARSGQYMGLCPGHNDTKPSLSIKEADGKILVQCFAGCELIDILKPLDLKPKDLFLNSSKSRKSPSEKKSIVAIYDYVDEYGRLLYQVVRYQPKIFGQRRPDGNSGWIWNMDGVTSVLYRLPAVLSAVREGKEIYITEGEKDADNMAAIGLVATTNPLGAGKWRDRYSEALRGADLIVIPDGDKPGQVHANDVAKSCFGKAKRLRMLVLPGEFKDVSDWLDSGGDIDQLEHLIASCPNYEPSKTLSQIQINNRQLRDITNEVLVTLYEANKTNNEIFTRVGNLVRIRADERGNPFIDSLTESALRGVLTRAADFIRINAGNTEVSETGVSPPLDVVQDILSLKQWEFPHLAALTEVPVVRMDGTLLTQPGYDAVTGLYYHPPPEFKLPAIPDAPKESDVRQAVTLIKEVLCDFPFDGRASAANALAIMLTPILIPIIDGLVPLAVFDKPQPGTGASLLCDVVALIATGQTAGKLGGYRKEEEWRKAITTILLHGHTVIVLDNIDGPLYSPSLATVLTTKFWRDRILGRNEDALLPNLAIWIANGNNIRLSGDLPRRAFWVRLDAQLAQPWLRQPDQFKHCDLVKWVKERRGDIIAAMLVVVRAWILDGKPKPPNLVTIGSYESFCQVLGGVLGYIEVEGFLQNLPQMYAQMDTETPQWGRFLEEWYDVFGEQGVTVAEVIKKLNDNEFFAATLPDSVADKDAKGYSRKLGNALAKRKDVRFANGLMIQAGNVKHHATAWKVVKADTAKLPIFTFGGELGNQVSTPCGCENEQTDGNKNTYEKGMQPNSLDSPSAIKTRELDKMPFRLPDRRLLNWLWCQEKYYKLGKPYMCLGDGDNIPDLNLYMYPEKISPHRLMKIVSWLEKHTKEKMPESIIKENGDNTGGAQYSTQGNNDGLDLDDLSRLDNLADE